jgi:DNA-binding CsgD family transcriptional regulator/transposase
MAKVRSDRTHPLPSSFEASRLFDAHEGSPLEPRALLVKLLVGNPEMPVSELAAAIGRSAPMTRLYLRVLREEGVDALLRTRSATKLSDEELDRVKAMIVSGRMGTVRQVRDWIEEQSEISYSTSGVSRLLKREAPVARRIEPRRHPGRLGGAPDRSGGDAVDDLIAGSRLLEFMNGLSSDLDPHVWSKGVKRGLAALLPGDPLIVITLNTSSELDPQKPQRPGVRFVTTGGSAPTTARDRARIRASSNVTTSNPERESTKHSLLRALTESYGIDLDHYHPPLITLFFLAENVYLGSIILLYRRNGSNPRKKAAELLDILGPFLRFCLSDGIARQHLALPERRLAQHLIIRFAYKYGLTSRERQVFMLHVIGVPYNEIAMQLERRPNTIKNQITAIHRKTGTASQGELLRKILVLDPEPEIGDVQPRPPV